MTPEQKIKTTIAISDIETIVEITTRTMLRVLEEQSKNKEEQPSTLGWQSSEVAARAMGISRWTLNNRKDLLRFNQDYRLVPGVKTRYQYHVENCIKKLKVASI